MRFIKRWLKRQLQIVIIRFLAKNNPNEFWLGGGWAYEAITGLPSFHEDVDLYIIGRKSSICPMWLKSKIGLEINQLYFQNNHVLSFKSPNWQFYISKKALEQNPRMLEGISVRTVSPAYLYACYIAEIWMADRGFIKETSKKRKRYIEFLIPYIGESPEGLLSGIRRDGTGTIFKL